MEEQSMKCAVCKNPSELKCTGCQQISYCSAEHQKEHWIIHKVDCVSYKVVNDDKLGRHLVASRDIKADTVIISELPYVIGPKFHQNYEVTQALVPCLGCYRPININTPQKCPKCQWPVCHENCPGLKESDNHAAECAVLCLCYKTHLPNIDPKFFRYSALIILRCLILQRKYPKKWQQLIKLQSHVESRKKGTEEYKEVDELARYLQENYFEVLKEIETKITSKILDNTSNNIIHEIAGILDVNALDIHVNDYIELSALYPTFSLLEHSCVPNTYYSFDLEQESSKKKFKVIVRAAGDIKKGEHLSTMYTHALWGTKLRRKHLFDYKYFGCECPRCKDPTEFGTFISGFKCLTVKSENTDNSDTCNGIQLPKNPLDFDSDWSCDRCNTLLGGEDVDFLESKMSSEVERVIAKPGKIQEVEEIMNKLSNFLHTNHYLMYQLKHSLIQMYGTQDGYKLNNLSDSQIQKKVVICEELLNIHSKIDPYDIRLQLYVSVILYELHTSLFELSKREFQKEELKSNALEKLKKVQDILKRCRKVLKSELQTKSGYKLNILIEKSTIEFEAWLLKNSINL